MTVNELISLRLANQQLITKGITRPEAIVAKMGAIQAQDYAAAKWATALRLDNNTDNEIEAAFNEGRILRTHVMRPTWHFVAPQDIRWLQKLTAHRVLAILASSSKKLGLAEAIYKKSNKLIYNALKNAKQLTRSEIEIVINKAGIPTDDLHMIHLMMRAELDGLICSGPRIGKQFSYALLDERVSPVKEIAKDEALARLTELYFTTRGPATLQDYVWWSGLTTSDARSGIAMIKSKLPHTLLRGQEYFYSSKTTEPREQGIKALLLPNFDEYSVSYKDRSLLYDAAKIKRALTPFAALGSNIVLDGQIVGTWKRTLRKDRVEIALSYFYAIPKVNQRSVTEAAERYGQFVGLPAMIINA